MKLPNGYSGKVEAKIIKIYTEPFVIADVLDRFENKFSEICNVIVSDNICYGGWELTFISNDNFSSRISYVESKDWYESFEPNKKSNIIYLVKIIKIIE
jgi:hypothetical protein